MEELKMEVIDILKGMAENRDMEEVIEEVLTYGCASGIISDLIYYYQTEEFFNKHKNAINELAHEISEDIYGNPFEIYKNLNIECSKNTMAWWSFEEMTRIIANEMEMDY